MGPDATKKRGLVSVGGATIAERAKVAASPFSSSPPNDVSECASRSTSAQERVFNMSASYRAGDWRRGRTGRWGELRV